MKKTICLTLVILTFAFCLTACNFTVNSLKDKAESTPKVEKMLTALTSGNSSEAKALLHPNANADAGNAINQMIGYLNGRSVSSTELTGVNFSSSVGTNGNVKQEQATYKVSLDGTETIYITAVYLTNNAGSGFISFQLVLGVI